MSDSNSTFRFCPKCNADTERYKSGGCKVCGRRNSDSYRLANAEDVKEKARQRAAAYRAKDPEAAKKKAAAYRAANIDRTKSVIKEWVIANKDRLRKTRYAWVKANPEKMRAYAIAWEKANPEAAREYARIRALNRRARVRKNGGVLSRELSEKLFNLQKGKCLCCDRPLGDDFHLDHVMPLALGGENIDSNMQLLRAECNLKKNAKHPVDFMQGRGFLL